MFLSGYIINLPGSIHPYPFSPLEKTASAKGGGFLGTLPVDPWPVPASFAERLDNLKDFPQR